GDRRNVEGYSLKTQTKASRTAGLGSPVFHDLVGVCWRREMNQLSEARRTAAVGVNQDIQVVDRAAVLEVQERRGKGHCQFNVAFASNVDWRKPEAPIGLVGRISPFVQSRSCKEI